MDKPTILIVDDERSARHGMRMLLERDYRIISAENSSSALEKLESNKVDIMLTDVRMPGRSNQTQNEKKTSKSK